MPIYTCLDSPVKCLAIWSYIPYEEIDFKRYYFVKTLRIECFNPAEEIEDTTYHPPRRIHPSSSMSRYYYNWTDTPRPIEEGPYKLPSIKDLFPKLETLIISNGNQCFKRNSPAYIDTLTDIPATVVNLHIEYTMLTNIGAIILQCPNIETLKLERNIYQISIPEQLPPKLLRLHVFLETLNTTLNVPSTLRYMHLVNSTIPGVDNLRYQPNQNIIIYGCVSPYDIVVLHDTMISCQDKINHINLVNAHQVYIHYGSIPARIRINKALDNDDHENPIIVALHLASNYPRRMAEFMSYI